MRKYEDSIHADLGDGKPEDWLITGEHPLLGAEDFGFYSQKAPSCMIWVGVGGNSPKHSPGFCIDERYIKLCTRAMATTALEYLTKE